MNWHRRASVRVAWLPVAVVGEDWAGRVWAIPTGRATLSDEIAEPTCLVRNCCTYPVIYERAQHSAGRGLVAMAAGQRWCASARWAGELLEDCSRRPSGGQALPNGQAQLEVLRRCSLSSGPAGSPVAGDLTSAKCRCNGARTPHDGAICTVCTVRITQAENARR